MRTRNKLLVLGLLAALALAACGITGLAQAGYEEPGSAQDPLVTKSFVEKLVNKKIQEACQGSVPGGGGSLQWQVEELKTGETFIGTAGTEFILRGGAAVIVDPTGSGIPDITAGTNLTAGKAVPANHLFTIPRSDGRGLKAVKPCIIMYRG